MDEPADVAVALAAGDQGEIRIGARRGEHGLVLAEARLVDDRAHEGAELRGIADGDRLGRRGERIAQPFPHRVGMYARDAAEHFWPWYSKDPRSSPTSSASVDADGCASTKSLPPVSPTRRGYVL